MEQVVKAVEFVSGFTLLAGVIVLLAALQTTHDERRYETALLNTLGARRSHVLYGLLAEFALLGLIAGVVAALTATVAEILLAEYVFHMDNRDQPLGLAHHAVAIHAGCCRRRTGRNTKGHFHATDTGAETILSMYISWGRT